MSQLTWSAFNRTTLEDLKVSYNNVFRFLFKLPRRVKVKVKDVFIV